MVMHLYRIAIKIKKCNYESVPFRYVLFKSITTEVLQLKSKEIR